MCTSIWLDVLSAVLADAIRYHRERFAGVR
jgi:hypothetical protein